MSYRSSRVLAFATVVVALAAAPKASAQVDAGEVSYWGGGNVDNWDTTNWENERGLITQPSWKWSGLHFGVVAGGAPQDRDVNGIVTNDVAYDLNVRSMYFWNQSWVLNGKSLMMDFGSNTIGVTSLAPSVTINTDIKFETYAGVRPTLNLNVDSVTSTLLINGMLRGPADVYKGGFGTLTLAGFHNYTLGTNVAAGRLIDHHPHGNYYTNADLEFSSNDDQTASGIINGGGSVTKSGNGTLTLSGDTSWTGTTKIYGGRLVMHAPWSSRSFEGLTNTALELNTTGVRTMNQPLSGQMLLVKSGSGTLTLAGTDTHSGGTTVTGGKLVDLTPSGLYAVDSELELRNESDLEYNGYVSGKGALVKSGAGVLVVGGNFHTGGTTVRQGRLVDYAPNGNYVNDAELEFRTVDDAYHGGLISGKGSLIKSLSGVLTLVGPHTHTGGTVVNQGRLIDLNPRGNYVVNGDLEFANATDVVFTSPAPSGPAAPNSFTGFGSFTKSGAGALSLYRSNVYLGSTTLKEGDIFAFADNVLPTSTRLAIDSGAAYVLGVGYRQTVGTLSGDGTVVLSDLSTFTVNGTTSTTFSGVVWGFGGLVKSGPSTLTLTGLNAYEGGTTVNGGCLIDLNPHGPYTTNAALEFAKAGDYAFGAPIGGTGSFTKSGVGTLTFTGVNTYEGGTTVDGGRLVDPNPHGDYAVAKNAALELRANEFQFLQGRVSGEGSLSKSGGDILLMADSPRNTGGVRVSGGLLDVEGAGSFGGGLVVDAGAEILHGSGGTLTIDGPSVNAGTVSSSTGSTTVFTGPVSGAGRFTGAGTVEFRGGYSPGNSPASVSFEGDLRLGSGNDLTMELGGAVLGAGYDHLSVLRNLSFRGKLDVRTLGGFSPTLGQSFDLFDFASATGTFASVSLPALGGGLRWDTSSLYTTGAIRTQAVPEPATLAVLAVGGLGLLRRRRK